ncbi:hypothetical protein Tco_0778824 [Tanacetum coccineum]
MADAMTAYEANKNSGTWINNDESGSVESCQVKFTTRTILDGALTWWNSYVYFVGLDAAYETTWKEVKEMMIEENWHYFVPSWLHPNTKRLRGADRSFVSTAFSSLFDITPNARDVKYTIELSDGKIIGADTIIRG